ncbi:MAG: hypothetical protein L0312_15710, partial [Acidobacteria bacterium]|nr:hypothetical protein [Acidobacteriota bacterium]
MRKPNNYTGHRVGLILALAGLLSGLAWPGYSRGQQLTDRAAVPLVTEPSWVATGKLNKGREGHTATLLVPYAASARLWVARLGL